MNEDSNLEDLAPWLLIGITLLGGFVRVLLLGEKGMWLDETFSIWLANHSLPEMLQWMARIDQHPPLYYLLLHYWMLLNGDTPYYARLLSALFGTATIPVIYLIGKRLSGAWVGLAAAVFLSVSPVNIAYAQETRMYTLLTFNAAAAICALAWLLTDPRSGQPIGSQFRAYIRAWRSPGPLEAETEREFSYRDELRKMGGWRGWIYRHNWLPLRSIETDLAWLAYIVFSTLTLLTHNTAVFFPIAANLIVLGLMLFQRLRRPTPAVGQAAPALQAPSLSNWVKAQIGMLVLWSPWSLVFIRQAARVDQQFWIPQPTWDGIKWTLRSLLNASAQTPTQAVMLWVLCAGLILGLVYYRKKLPVLLFLAALFATPILGELLVSLRRPIFLERTLLWVTIPMFLLLAAGIAQLRFRLLMVLVLAALATNYLFSSSDYFYFYQKEDWYTPAGYVARYAEKDDLILFNSNFVVIPFDYYFKPFEQQYSLEVVRQGVPLDLYTSQVLEPIMSAGDVPALVSMLNGHARVWLVYSHDSYTDPLGLIPRTLAAHRKMIQERDFYGGVVKLYGEP